MIVDDNELRQALALMDAYKDRVEALTRQVQVLRMSLDEVSMALEAVKAFKDAKEGDEIMVPVGASCYIPVKVTGNRTVITGIGSGISIQKTSDESVDYLDKSSAEIAEALKKSIETLNESQQNLTAVSEAVQQEYAARRQAPNGSYQ